MVHTALSAAKLASHWWGYRREFASLRQAIRAVNVRLLATNSLRNRVSRRPVALLFRGQTDPVFVRQGTEDIVILEEILLEKEYQHAVSLSGDSGWIVDLGGNIGLAARYFADQLPRHSIHSVEPDVGNLKLLSMNTANAQASGRLTYRRAFVAAASGQSSIDRSVQPAGYRMAPAKGDEVDDDLIPCVPLVTILDDAGINNVSLLKCDVEGAEAELFADCAGWIHRVHAMVIETHKPYTPSLLADDLRRAGWNGAVVSETHRDDFAVVHYKRLDA